MTLFPPFARAASCRPLAALCACVGLILAPSIAVGQNATGSIHGQVSNSATGDNLEGARITVDSGREVTTARDGSYVIDGVSPGVHHLTFDYTGLDRQTIEVDVAAGGKVRKDVTLTSDLYKLSKFVVASTREGNAAAIVQQRNAVNVQNVVTSDAFGNIAKGNVGNFLKRLPGIVGTTDEVDTDNIVLRGMGANLTSVDIDGTRSASGNPDGRSQLAGSIPTDMIEKAEVVKAPTPDMDMDSLGGRINLVTKSAFDRQGRRIDLRAAGTYSFTAGKTVGRRDPLGKGDGDWFAPSVGLSYSDVYSVLGGERNLGMIANANYERVAELRGTTAWNWGSATGSSTVPVGTRDYPQFNNVSIALHELIRRGGGLRFDYKFSPRSMIQVSGGYNEYENNMFRTRNLFTTGTVNATVSDPDPYFILINGARYEALRETRDQKTKKSFGRIAGKTDQIGLKLDYDLSWDRAKRDEYRTSADFTSNRRFNYVLDRRLGQADPRWPTLRIVTPATNPAPAATATTPTTFLSVNPFGDDLADVGSSTVFWRRQFTTDELWGAKLNATKDLAWKFPVQLKTGFRYRSDTVKTDRDELNGGMNLTALHNDLRGFLHDGWDLGGAINRYPAGSVPSAVKVGRTAAITWLGYNGDPRNEWSFDPNVFARNDSSTVQNSLLNDRKIFEDEFAYYGQGQVEFGRLQILGGVRVERTKIDSIVPVRDRRATDLVAQFSRRDKNSQSYANSLPSVHTRYRFTPNLQLHASFSTTIGRPDYGDIIGSSDIDTTTKTVSAANLDLKPQHSNNYDLSLEYYFEPVGVLSAGLFQKDITNYASTVTQTISAADAAEFGAPVSPDPNDLTWSLTTKQNTGTARVRGAEFNYTQSLQFLPGYWRGLGIYANYTMLETEGTFNTGKTSTTHDLTNFVPRTGNAGITYVYGRWDLRTQINWTSQWLESVDTTNPQQRNKWRGANYTIDVLTKYKLTRGLTLFADFLNVTTNYGKKYRGYVDPVRREETNAVGFIVTAGIQGRF